MSEHTHTYTHEHGHTHESSEHAHEHSHTYTHDHEGGDVEHTHDHPDHDHDHEHHHKHPSPENEAQVKALLEYMCKHNESHEEELTKMADKLKDLGHDSEAVKVREAKESFAKGNEALRQALELLK